MSLAEFNKATPSDLSIPRTRDPNDAQWGHIDISMHKNPQEQAKHFTKKVVSASEAQPATGQISAAAAPTRQRGFADFATVAESAGDAPTTKTNPQTKAPEETKTREDAEPTALKPDRDWNEVKERKEAKQDKRDANVYKAPPSNRPKNAS